MDQEQTFWLRIWQTIAVLCGVVVLTMTGCTSYESKLVADAISAGANPIDARCGIGGMTNQSTLCAMRASKE